MSSTMMDRRIYEERPNTVASSGGMIVHQQTGARVPGHTALRVPIGSTATTSTQFTDSIYTWQPGQTVTTAPHGSNMERSTFDSQMYYTSELFSNSGANDTHLKGATIIEPSSGALHMKSSVPNAIHHELTSGPVHQMHAGAHSINVVPAGAIVVTSQGMAASGQLVPVSAVGGVSSGAAHQITLAPPAMVVNNTANMTSVSTQNNGVKKKKRPVKSKKKQIIKEEDPNESNECPIYPDDMIYIRSSSSSTAISLRHTVNINDSSQHDPKAMKLLNPRPEHKRVSDNDSDDESRCFSGVGVWEYGKIWNHHLTIKLLETLHKNKKRMFSRDSRKLLYLELSSMFQQEDNKDLSIDEIEKKWCSLLSSYKRNQNRIKNGEEVSWGYYQIMDEIMTEGKHIRRLNRDRPKRFKSRSRRLSEDDIEFRNAKATCKRKTKKLKKTLSDRLELVRQEREDCLLESKSMWDSVKDSIGNINESISILNSSVVMLGHSLNTFLSNLENIDKPS